MTQYPDLRGITVTELSKAGLLVDGMTWGRLILWTEGAGEGERVRRGHLRGGLWTPEGEFQPYEEGVHSGLHPAIHAATCARIAHDDSATDTFVPFVELVRQLVTNEAQILYL